MKTWQTALKARLATRGMTQVAIGALAIERAKKFAMVPSELTGYIRAHQLFLRGSVKENPTQWFLQKKKILDEINHVYKEHGYEYLLQDIKFKR